MQNWPQGEPFWNIWSFSQSIQWLVLWIATRVMSPILAVNWYIWLGWCGTGLIVFLIARHFGSSEFGAVCAALFAQMLPWYREQVMTHISYVWLCVPLGIVLLTLRALVKINFNSVTKIAVGLSLVSLFDLYFFYFSIFILIILMLSDIPSVLGWFSILHIRMRTFFLGFLALLIAISAIAFRYLSSIVNNPGSAKSKLIVSDASFVDQFGGTLLRYVRPSSDHLLFPSTVVHGLAAVEDVVAYAGLSIIVLAVIAIKTNRSLRKRGFHRSRNLLIPLILFFGALGLPTKITVLGWTFPTIVNLVRFVTPGIRVYSRGGLIAELLMCVLAGLTISDFNRSRMKTLTKIFVSFSIVSICVIDLNPFGRRFVNSDYASYESIRDYLSEFDTPVVLPLDSDLDPSKFPFYYFAAPTVVSSNTHLLEEEISLHETLGDEDFAAYLGHLGVTHIVVATRSESDYRFRRKWGELASVNLPLSEPWFREVARSDPDEGAVLIEVSNAKRDYCRLCYKYVLTWQGVRTLFSRPGYVSDLYYEDGPEISWVLPNETPRVTLRSDAPSGTKFQITFELVPAYGGQAQPQIVRVNSYESRQIVRLAPGQKSSISVVVEAGQEVSLQRFLPCTVPAFHEPGNTDMRGICYAVASVHVKQVVR